MSGKKIASRVLQKIREMVEEVEDLDELSRDTLRRYRMKAKSIGDNEMGDIGYRSKGRDLAARKTHGGQWGIPKAKVMAKEEAEDLGEGKWNYPKHMTKTVTTSDMDTTNAQRNREERKAFRKKEKAKAHAALMKGVHKEEYEELDEISQMMARAARDKAGEEIAGHKKSIEKEWNRNKPNYGKISDIQQQWARRERLSDKVTRKLAKEEIEQVDECDMTDTSLSDIASSAKGEVYSKSNEKTSAATKPTGTKTGVTPTGSGEAYNTTAATTRMPALEHAIRSVMERSYEIKAIYNESAGIPVVSHEQRDDWMNVERGSMNVVDYFNKYRIMGED